MQFQVPQFLDVEDKIVGPFTLKQFLYLAGGLGFGYIALRFIPLLGWVIGFGMVALGVALAYYKFNGKPFVYIIEAGFYYLLSNRMFIWRRQKKEKEELDLSNFKQVKNAGNMLAGNSTSKLNDLTWSMDIKQENEVEVKKVHSDNVA